MVRFHAKQSTVVENAKSGLAHPLLEITKHGYGGEASDTTPNKQRAISSMCRAAKIADSGLIHEWRSKKKAEDVRLKSSGCGHSQ